ncbi:hypothetical protein BASA81_006222 [Batrachochytrium salamandrivorans]|nr:hypothetical protein BASA81_006222 [Batrachochytrium salamandrivorans]
MEDELEMLEAVYPNIAIERDAASPMVVLSLDHRSYNGQRATLVVHLFDSCDYPHQSRPRASIMSGLGSEDKSKVLGKINQAVEEDFRADLCLLAVFTTFVEFVDSELSVDCGVCLDSTDYASGDFYITAQCRHVFHQTCFEEWSLQCLANQDANEDSLLTRTRRKQVQAVAESELKMAHLRADNLGLELARNQTRKLVLAGRMAKLDGAAAVSIVTVSKSLERDKEDVDVIDPLEVSKRIDLVNKELRKLQSEITAANKQVDQCRTNLQTTLQQLQRELACSETERTIPCPACRTPLTPSSSFGGML